MVFDGLRQFQDTITDFIIHPFDAAAREKLKADRELLTRIRPCYEELMGKIAGHPDQLRIVLALRYFTGFASIPSGQSKTAYWQRVAAMKRKLGNDVDSPQWLERFIPALEELLSEAPSEQ